MLFPTNVFNKVFDWVKVIVRCIVYITLIKISLWYNLLQLYVDYTFHM